MLGASNQTGRYFRRNAVFGHLTKSRGRRVRQTKTVRVLKGALKRTKSRFDRKNNNNNVSDFQEQSTKTTHVVV